MIIYTIFNYIFLFSYWLLLILVILKILIKRRTISSLIAWLLMIYILPLIGSITYLLFGEFNIGKKRYKKSKIIWTTAIHQIKKLKKYKQIFSNKNNDITSSLFKLCEYHQGIGASTGNNIKLFKKTNDVLHSIIKDIKLAKHSIYMIFYIWESEGLIDKIVTHLITASQRGVKCKLILDSAGCKNFFHSPHLKIMQNAGVNIVEALHVNYLHIFFRRMDLRQHRKMILIDKNIAYTGSMNMADPNFFKKNIGIGQWIDIMIRINGPATSAMNIIFSSDWEIETGEHIFSPLLDTHHLKINSKQSLQKHTIQIVPSGPGFPKGIIHQVLLTLIYKSNKKIIITTPYLVPSDDLSYAICTAAQRGVEVHIIIPKKNDSILVHWASRAFFTELLKAGVLIHQFHKGLLHTKSILIDQQISVIGTANLDIRSIWLNFEITAIIDSKDFSNDLAKIQQDYIAHSLLVDLKKWEKRPYWEKIIERLFYFLSPLL